MLKRFFLKLKQLAKIPLSNDDYDYVFERDISVSPVFSNLTKQEEARSVVYQDKFNINVRKLPFSDAMVLKQVILEQEYKPVIDALRDNFPNQQSFRIIDAGANVGYTTIYFLNYLVNSVVACIEPDEQNVKMLNKNLSAFLETGQVRIFQNGLMSQGNKSIITNRDFRDGKDWSISVSESEVETSLKSITVEDIMNTMGWDEVEVLKIDIEGAERFVFDSNSGLDYLNSIKILAIEIHDEFDIRKSIYSILRSKGFVIFLHGETTIALNQRLIKI